MIDEGIFFDVFDSVESAVYAVVEDLALPEQG